MPDRTNRNSSAPRCRNVVAGSRGLPLQGIFGAGRPPTRIPILGSLPGILPDGLKALHNSPCVAGW